MDLKRPAAVALSAALILAACQHDRPSSEACYDHGYGYGWYGEYAGGNHTLTVAHLESAGYDADIANKCLDDRRSDVEDGIKDGVRDYWLNR